MDIEDQIKSGTNMFSLRALKEIGPGNQNTITWSYFLSGKGYVMFRVYTAMLGKN
jgi:hypothetical protein